MHNKCITFFEKKDNQIRSICVEDLHLKGLQKNHHLARSLSSVALGKFYEMLEYKCAWKGINLIKIDRFAPSSKKCSVCGNVKKDLTLADREYCCDFCGAKLDRDFNAAVNIRKFGLLQEKIFVGPELSEVTLGEIASVDDRFARNLKSILSKNQEKFLAQC